MTDHTDIVRAIRSRYPAKIDDPTCFAIVNEAAKATAISAEGWGLLKCPPGARGFVVAGQNYRVQRLCKPDGTLVQLLGSSGSGDAIAEWAVSLNDPNATAENWAPPVGADQSHPPPLDPPVVVVTPPVIVAPADTSARDAHIFALLRSIQVAIVAADQHNVAKLEEIKAAFIKSSKDIGTVLGGLAAGGGVTGLLGGLLNKK